MSIQHLSIKALKEYYISLFKDLDAAQSIDTFKTFIRTVVYELSWGLDVDLQLLEKDIDDPVICKTRHLGALESLNRVLPDIAENTTSKATKHPDWSLLAGRIEIQSLKVGVPDTFAEGLNEDITVWRKDGDYD